MCCGERVRQQDARKHRNTHDHTEENQSVHTHTEVLSNSNMLSGLEATAQWPRGLCSVASRPLCDHTHAHTHTPHSSQQKREHDKYDDKFQIHKSSAHVPHK